MKAVAPGLLALLAGCVTLPTPTALPEHPAEYQCKSDWQTPDSRFVVEATLAEDGRFKAWHLIWLRHSTDYGFAGWVTQFDFEGPRLPAPDDDWSLMLDLSGFAPGSRTVRVELLRGGVNGTDVPVLSVPRARAEPNIFTNWRRNAVRTALAGAPELLVRVTDRRGRIRLSHRLPSAVLDGPAEAVTARRAELEAMVADYRNRCTFVPAGSEIVIT
ncbi:hypothetical protein [Allosphingosinicella sp.]|uniref:hypothetical protein n=1 Tax=Allosphingosinicella sp. TaxID=2823234 RepID=UPI0037844A21